MDRRHFIGAGSSALLLSALAISRASGQDIEKVLDHVVARVGYSYDRRNIFDLFRYLLPVRLIPARLREDALHFGSGKDTQTIC